MEVAGEVDFWVAVAVAGAEGVGRERVGEAGEDGGAADGAVVALDAHGVREW